jgi:hypothetical protein
LAPVTTAMPMMLFLLDRFYRNRVGAPFPAVS